MSEMFYQKFRPTKWEDLVGNKVTIQALQQFVIKDNIPQVIYISGKTGYGKTTLGMLLSMAITCTNIDRETGNPCGECDTCQDIINQNWATSVYYYNCAQKVGKEQIMEISEIVSSKSMYGNKKVIFLDEIQELNSNKVAQKGLLPVTEKINPNVHYILMSMEDAKVDFSVKSRGKSYFLKEPTFEDIARALQGICKKIQLKIDEKIANAIILISQNCFGSYRDAVNKFEQCVDSDMWDEETIKSELKILSVDKIQIIIKNILTANIEIFDSELDEHLISNVRYILSLLYKYSLGARLNKWQKDQINQIKDCNIDNISYTLNQFNSLLKFPYSDRMLIDTIISDCFKHNKENTIVKRRSV